MAILKNAIKAFDPAPEKKNEVEKILTLLFELAESKTDNFKKEIVQSLRTAGTEENPTIPVTQVLRFQADTRAYTVEDSAKIINEATLAIKGFIQGGAENIVNGIGNLLGTAVNALLGSGHGIQAQRDDYFVAVEGLSIVRVDVKSWVRKVEISGVTKKIDSIFAFVASKSSVDVDKITFNTFLQAYQFQLLRLQMPQDELIKEITKAREVFDILQSKNPKASTHNFEALVSKLPASSI